MEHLNNYPQFVEIQFDISDAWTDKQKKALCFIRRISMSTQVLRSSLHSTGMISLVESLKFTWDPTLNIFWKDGPIFNEDFNDFGARLADIVYTEFQDKISNLSHFYENIRFIVDDCEGIFCEGGINLPSEYSKYPCKLKLRVDFLCAQELIEGPEFFTNTEI